MDSQPATDPDQFASVDRAGTGSMKWLKYPHGVLPMWVADMDFRAAAPIVDALHDRIAHGVYGYTLPTDRLARTCVEYFARRWAWQVDPQHLVYSPGLGVGLHTVARHIGDRSQPLLVPRPIYKPFRDAPTMAKRARIDLPFVRGNDSWVLDLDDLDACGARAGAQSVLMLCNPHNPNGKVYTAAELERIGEIALRHGWIICADEVHADLILTPGLAHIPIASLDPQIAAITITMQSPSKAFNVAGLNFAALVIDDDGLRRQYQQGAAGQVIAQLNPLGMVAAEAAWSGSCDAWLADCLAFLRSQRDHLRQAVNNMDKIDMPELDSTYLAWLDVSRLELDDPAAHFESHGIGMSPGAGFGDDRHMRLNFGCDRPTLDQGIACLAAAAGA